MGAVWGGRKMLINVNVEVPDGNECKGCRFWTPFGFCVVFDELRQMDKEGYYKFKCLSCLDASEVTE